MKFNRRIQLRIKYLRKFQRSSNKQVRKITSFMLIIQMKKRIHKMNLFLLQVLVLDLLVHSRILDPKTQFQNKTKDNHKKIRSKNREQGYHLVFLKIFLKFQRMVKNRKKISLQLSKLTFQMLQLQLPIKENHNFPAVNNNQINHT